MMNEDMHKTSQKLQDKNITAPKYFKLDWQVFIVAFFLTATPVSLVPAGQDA
jgi:hypothetical protein